jgi:hypothetical protein
MCAPCCARVSKGSYDVIWTTTSKFASICFSDALCPSWLHLCLSFQGGTLSPWALYKSIDNPRNFILKDKWFYNHCWMGYN